MRIAVDVRSLMGRPTGIGHYTAQLLRHLPAVATEVILYGFGGGEPSAPLHAALGPRVRLVRHPLPMRMVRQLWRRVRAPRLESITGPVDVVIAAETTVPVTDAPVLAVAYDTLWAEHPEWFNRYTRRAGPENLADAARRARQLVTISERSRRGILGLHREVKDKLGIVFPSVEPARLSRARRDDGTILFVGTFEPRKGLGVLAEALLRARGAASRATLVVCGPPGWGNPSGRASLAALEAQGRCDMRGYVTKDELARLRSRCAVAVVPFLDEGFGLPLLDALAAGAPTIASNIEVFREVGGDAFMGVPPNDADALAAALDRLLDDGERRRDFEVAGPQRAARFSTEEQGTALLGALEATAPGSTARA